MVHGIVNNIVTCLSNCRRGLDWQPYLLDSLVHPTYGCTLQTTTTPRLVATVMSTLVVPVVASRLCMAHIPLSPGS
jgi:hypothetical protein